jgi:hypothetical protein
MTSHTKNLQQMIESLANADASAREKAARAIFEVGAELAAPLLRTWMGDVELARCFNAGANSSATAAGSPGADPPGAKRTWPEITVGIAVEPERFEAIRAASGSPRLADVPPDQDAKEFELEFPRGVRLDVLTRRDPRETGAIARYLRKFGEGIQQIEVGTKDVDRATTILRTRFGTQPLYPATRAGANRTRVNFFLVTTPAGSKLLVELVGAVI